MVCKIYSHWTIIPKAHGIMVGCINGIILLDKVISHIDIDIMIFLVDFSTNIVFVELQIKHFVLFEPGCFTKMFMISKLYASWRHFRPKIKLRVNTSEESLNGTLQLAQGQFINILFYLWFTNGPTKQKCLLLVCFPCPL
jgi:hypothetical protein